LAKFAILIEYDLPDGFDDQIIVPALDVIRNLPAPATPEMVTAFAGEAAEAMTQARRAT